MAVLEQTETAPWVPALDGPEDTKFCAFEDEEFTLNPVDKHQAKDELSKGSHLRFVGYTYLRHANPQLSWSTETGAIADLPPLPSKADTRALDEAKRNAEALETSNRELTKQITSMLSEVTRLKETEALSLRLEREKTDLEFDLDSSKRRLRSVQREKEELEKRIESLEEAQLDLPSPTTVGSFHALTEELEAKRRACIELETSLATARAELSTLDSRLRDVQASSELRTAALNQKIQELQASLTAAKLRADQAEAGEKEFSAKVVELAESLRAARERESAVAARLSAEQAVSAKQASKLAASQTELEETKSQLAQMICRAEQLVAEVERLSVDKDAASGLQALLEDARRQLAKKDDEVSQLRAQKTSEESEKAGLIAKAASDALARNDLETRLAEATSQLSLKTAALLDSQTETLQLKSTIEALEATVSRLENDLVNQLSLSNALIDRLATSDSAHKEQEGEKARLQSLLQIEAEKVTGLQNQMALLETAKAKAESSLHEAKEQKAKLREDYNEESQARESLARRLDDAMDREQKVLTDLQQAKRDLVEKDAVIDGLRLELQTTQENMRDLREKETAILIGKDNRISELESRVAELQQRVNELNRRSSIFSQVSSPITPTEDQNHQGRPRAVKRADSGKRTSFLSTTLNVFSRRMGGKSAIVERAEDGVSIAESLLDDSKSEILDNDSSTRISRNRRMSGHSLSPTENGFISLPDFKPDSFTGGKVCVVSNTAGDKPLTKRTAKLEARCLSVQGEQLFVYTDQTAMEANAPTEVYEIGTPLVHVRAVEATDFTKLAPSMIEKLVRIVTISTSSLSSRVPEATVYDGPKVFRMIEHIDSEMAWIKAAQQSSKSDKYLAALSQREHVLSEERALVHALLSNLSIDMRAVSDDSESKVKRQLTSEWLW